MKKYIFLVVGCLILTGCNRNKIRNLECSNTITENENVVKNVVEVKYIQNNVDTLWFKTETILAEKYLDYIDTFEEKINNGFNEYVNKKGISINSTKRENSIVFNMEIDVNLLDSETKNKLGITDTYSEYNTTKKNLEQKGYVCKEK